jgi:hypothetical protein
MTTWTMACSCGKPKPTPRDKVFVVLRTDPEVRADTSAYFSSDRTGIRCVLRRTPYMKMPSEKAI